MTSLDPQLARIAREHEGLITRAHAAARHISPNLLRSAVAAGTVHRLRPGVFVTLDRWGPASLHERYCLTIKGVLLMHPGWLASHHAALAMHGLPLYGVDLEVIDVAADVKASKLRPGLHVHVAFSEHVEVAAQTQAHAIPVSAACVLTAAASGLEAGVVAMDAALRRRLTNREQLTKALTLRGARYGVAQARAAVEAADAKCESPGESRTRLILRAAGLTVRSQVVLADEAGDIGRVDFLVGANVVVEFDGLVKYEGADGKVELAREKAREDRLRAAGFRIVRITWADLRHPERIVGRVRRELHSAA